MYKISIIIPVYNEEDRLHRSVDSILNQNWDGDILNDLEIVLVDNCSTDNSMSVMLEYQKKYSNINIYSTEENIGVASIARNIGIKMSKAPYVMFLDADDEYGKDMCRTLYRVIHEKNVDIVTSNYCFIINSEVHKKPPIDLTNIDVETDGDYIIFDKFNSLISSDWLMWKRIYKKSFLIENNIVFPPKVCEDTIFSINAFSKMDKMIYIKDFYGYKHHIRKDSVSESSDANTIINYLDGLMDVYDLLDLHIDYESNEEYRFIMPRAFIFADVSEIILLNDFKDINRCLDKLYEYESKIQFDNSLVINSMTDRIIKLINYFILKNQRKIVIFLIKLCKIALNFKSTFS